ncbi:MAG: 16S rRNA (cytosine(1402)-N(4))-methyltransferase RsmH [Ruthenibacterium sp.]
MHFEHVPVLLAACIEGLAIQPGGIYLDGTAGGAGHSKEIALRLTSGRLYSLDQDPDAVRAASERLQGLPATVLQTNFRMADSALAQVNVTQIDGALLDLGVSSHQLDELERGFSYQGNAPLDMRMSQSGPSAADLVNGASRDEIARVLREYGEEPYAWQIAGKIIAAREITPLQTTAQLVSCINAALPAAVRRKEKNPARRSFQALRIAVNGEMDALNEGLDAIFSLLKPGGRFCIIKFNSLEDRLVKQRFRAWATACTCPPEFPVCVCGGKARAKLITRKPIEASAEEQEQNRRARSAKLRVLEKL